MLTTITTAVPPLIADLDFTAGRDTAGAVERAAVAIVRLDSDQGTHLAGLGAFLLRSEAVSSSRIEQVLASRKDFARAMVGAKATGSGRSTVAAVRALEGLVTAAGRDGVVTEEALLSAHHDLMAGDPDEKRYAGRYRDVQNWIRGSDHSPLGAVHVPPPPDLVPALMADLLTFVGRDDLPAVTQAALAHAQFESIHPFTDGNGRIGRALISAVLRRRGLAIHTVVPVASAMLADVGRYFDLVNDYRTGAAGPFVRYVAGAATAACAAAAESAEELAALPAHWQQLARPRAGSAAAKILQILLRHPVLDAHDTARLAGVSMTAAYDGIEALTRAGVLDPLSAGARNQVWVATPVLDEIDAMNRRLGSRQHPV